MRLAEASEVTGVRGESLSQLVRTLRSKSLVRLDTYSTLTLTAAGLAASWGTK